MKQQEDAFQGSPWNVVPSEDWNCQSHWTAFYEESLADLDSWQREQLIFRDADFLVRMLTDAGELPRSTPKSLLDVGCGVALLPHLLALWGFRVTAIDSCLRAIEASSQQKPNEEELAGCISIWEPTQGVTGAYTLVQDPAPSLQRLRSFKVSGGSLSYVAGDWFTAPPPVGEFGMVYCRNSLRCSTKPYWRKSLRCFYQLLSSGGVLLLENINAIGIRGEVEGLLSECGFVSLAPRGSRQVDAKYVVDVWPTG